MKKIFSFYFCLLLSIAAWGDTTATVDGIKYILDGSNATVTYPNDSEPGTSEYTGNIVIPATITVEGNTYNVTAIGNKAFRKASITSISLPEGLLSIGQESLYKTNISEITVPNSVTTFGEYAIAYNSKLKKITFGTNCSENGWATCVCYRESPAYDVYMNCDAVPRVLDHYMFDHGYKSRIHVKPSVFDDFVADSKWNKYNIITELGTIDGIKYLKDGRGNAYVTYPNDTEPGTSSYEGDIVIPATVSDGGKEYKVIAIEDKAFRKASITSISLPEGLLSIGQESLYKTNISEITVPNSVTSIGDQAMQECPNLQTITLGEHCADNKWGAWVFWRSSGGYDVYMICDVKPSLYDNQTFDDSHASTIHVMPNLEDSYNEDSNWGGICTIVGDLDKTYPYLQNVITSNEVFLANEVGTDPGFYSSANPTALGTAITAAKALTKSASGDDIAAAISAMNSAKNDYIVNPLSEGYYYIESAYDGKFMKSYPAAQAKDSGIENVDFEQNLKLYFNLIKDGDDWLIQGNDPDHMYFGDPNSVYTNYPTVRVENTYKQKITAVGTGKYMIQYNDGSTLSDPYANTGDWVKFKNYSAGSADEARMYWYFRKAEVLSKTDVASKVATAVSNGKTNLNLSGYLLANDVDASDMLAAGTNLLVKVASTSGITGQNIVNNGVCANLVLTDGQPFGYTENFTATTASYNRSVTNTFGTVCLPYAVSSDENIQYYTLNNIAGSTLFLTAQDEIAAGVPAVFEMLKGGSTLTANASGVTVVGSVPAAAAANPQLIGTFSSVVLTGTDLTNSYYISKDKFYQATNSITVNPFRAYFTYSGSASVKTFNLSVLDEETGIETIGNSAFKIENSVYDLSGRKVNSQMHKGVYIVNGKKYMK